MALINRSFFYGDISIPDLENPLVQESINYVIDKREKDLLVKLFGYKMYKDFMSGLMASSVDPKWTHLLTGTDYQDGSNNLHNWRGIVSQPDGILAAMDSANVFEIVVGRGGPFDPEIGSNSTIIPPQFVGTEFIFEMRGVGMLTREEYSVVDDVLTFTGSEGSIVFPDPLFGSETSYVGGPSRFFFKAPTLAVNTMAGSYKESMIANYVYYWHRRDNASRTTAMGPEVISSSENSDNVSPSPKMVRAWNEMVDWIEEMNHYLEVKSALYPDRRPSDYDWSYINTFNI